MDNWSAFIVTLRTQFGSIDPAGDAKNSIDHLKMQDNQCIVKYNIEFNRLAIHTSWDENILRHCYYTGLAKRIKDIMGHQEKPATLDAMKLLAHTINARHWECIREKSRSGKSKSDNKADDKTSSAPPIELRLFDGTSNSIITQSVNLPVSFPIGESMTINFYVTLLNLSCTVVLAHPLQSIDWLGIGQYNFLATVAWLVSSVYDVICTSRNLLSLWRLPNLKKQLHVSRWSVLPLSCELPNDRKCNVLVFTSLIPFSLPNQLPSLMKFPTSLKSQKSIMIMPMYSAKLKQTS